MPNFSMSRTGTLITLITFILCGATVPRSVGDAASEGKLREALRNTMLQLRTAQNERAALQTTQTENEAKLKKLNAQVEALTKQIAAAEKSAAEQQAQLAKYKEAIQSWETAYKQAVGVATEKEDARVKSANEVTALRRQVADQQVRNAEMFRTASEILKRYEHFGLGEALAAKEPFVGVTRVKLENLVQEYEDRLAGQRIRDGDSATRKAAAQTQASPTPNEQRLKQKAGP